MHSENVKSLTSSIMSKHYSIIDEAFKEFDKYLIEIENEPSSLHRNVRMMLACKLFNHVYSALVLTENGLIVDAIISERSALETIAFYWLICIDPESAKYYEQEKFLRPVDVRKKLEELGVDISQLRGLYASGSNMTHVGRKSEKLYSEWKSPSNGTLLFGGSFSAEDQNEMFSFLPALLYLLRQYDAN